MKAFKNNNEFFFNTLYPVIGVHKENVNAFTIYSQPKFNDYLKLLGATETGPITDAELSVIQDIKDSIQNMIIINKTVDRDRLDFDLAIIFHSNLKKLGWGRYLLDEYNMWRWFSMNYFLKETFWRRGEVKWNKKLYVDSAKSTYDHLVGTRTRDIFPRRYFLIGERLYHPEGEYSLANKLSQLCKESKYGGFGNLMLNMIDTKLSSPNDHVSKIISEVLFTQGKLADDKEVARAFGRYNGFKRRLLNSANKDVFENEICIG